MNRRLANSRKMNIPFYIHAEGQLNNTVLFLGFLYSSADYDFLHVFRVTIDISSSNHGVIIKFDRRCNYLYFEAAVLLFYLTKNFSFALGLKTMIAQSARFG